MKVRAIKDSTRVHNSAYPYDAPETEELTRSPVPRKDIASTRPGPTDVTSPRPRGRGS